MAGPSPSRRSFWKPPRTVADSAKPSDAGGFAWRSASSGPSAVAPSDRGKRNRARLSAAARGRNATVFCVVLTILNLVILRLGGLNPAQLPAEWAEKYQRQKAWVHSPLIVF